MSELFKELRKKIEKVSKGSHISLLSESDISNHNLNISTPLLDLNRILSGSLYKGLLDKTFTFIVGPEHSFKSSFIALCLAECQKNGYTPVIIDTEGGFNSDFAERWGLNPDKTIYVYEPKVDKVLVIINKLLESGEKFALGLDSIGGLYKEKVLSDANTGDVKADQGMLQKEIKVLLKIIVTLVKSNNSMAFASGHYYGNPTGYGEADKIGGGKYVKLAPDYIISLKKGKLKENDNIKKSNVIGNRITAITMKNRFYPPFQEASINIDFKKGVDKYSGILDLGVNLGIIERNGAWYSYNNEKIGQGNKNANDYLIKNENIILEIDKKLKTTGYSNINKEVELKIQKKIEQEENN